MRSVLVGAAILALAACGGEADKEPNANAPGETTESKDATSDKATEDSAGAAETDAEAALTLTLEGGGLTAGSEKLLFNAGRTEVDTALKAVLGDPTGTNSNDECGAGNMEFTDYAGGLTVNFMEGQLVGWNWRAPADGDLPTEATMSAAGDVKLGTPKATVEAISGYSDIPDSTLGEEFSLSGSYAGFFEDGSVSMLYGGDQCFFR